MKKIGIIIAAMFMALMLTAGPSSAVVGDPGTPTDEVAAAESGATGAVISTRGVTCDEVFAGWKIVTSEAPNDTVDYKVRWKERLYFWECPGADEYPVSGVEYKYNVLDTSANPRRHCDWDAFTWERYRMDANSVAGWDPPSRLFNCEPGTMADTKFVAAPDGTSITATNDNQLKFFGYFIDTQTGWEPRWESDLVTTIHP